MPTLDRPPTLAMGAQLRRQGRALLVAVQFLTRLPTPPVDLSDEADRRDLLGQAPVYFPLVGAGVGALTGGSVLLAGRVWPLGLAVVLGLAVEAIVTGAFHEDAVADCADAFGGGWTRDDVLRILKDSRVGAFGVVGLGLALALRGGATAALAPELLFAAVVTSATLGRWAILVAMALLPPLADRASLSADVARGIGPGRLIWGTLLAAPGCLPVALLVPGRLAAMLGAVVVVTVALVAYVRRRLGGMTGDGLGATAYAGQVVALLVAAGHWAGGWNV